MPEHQESQKSSKSTVPVKPLQRVERGDRVLMRKSHPCGSLEWSVTRIGADIGLRCEGCGRRMMLTRDEFYRASRRLLTPETVTDAELWNTDASPEPPLEAPR